MGRREKRKKEKEGKGREECSSHMLNTYLVTLPRYITYGLGSILQNHIA